MFPVSTSTILDVQDKLKSCPNLQACWISVYAWKQRLEVGLHSLYKSLVLARKVSHFHFLSFGQVRCQTHMNQTNPVYSESCPCEHGTELDPATLIHRDETSNFYDPLHMQSLRVTPSRSLSRHQFLSDSHERLPHHISDSLSCYGRSCDSRDWSVLPCCAALPWRED